jgi:hypothetical protein
VGAFDDSFGAVLHAAVAGDGNLARGSILPRDELPAGSFAKLAILESHADSIRLRKACGKVSALGKLWTVGQAFLPVSSGFFTQLEKPVLLFALEFVDGQA